jgi:hypothetical protein
MDRREREIMPGVYFTPAAEQPTLAPSAGIALPRLLGGELTDEQVLDELHRLMVCGSFCCALFPSCGIE